jgi:hypothetical protein
MSTLRTFTADSVRDGISNLPLGSVHSRAAARLLLERLRITEKRSQIIFCMCGIELSASPWTRQPDGTLERVIWLPGDANMAECLNQVGGFSDAEIGEIVERHPLVPVFEIILLGEF